MQLPPIEALIIICAMAVISIPILIFLWLKKGNGDS
jgi:hypothetical protein